MATRSLRESLFLAAMLLLIVFLIWSISQLNHQQGFNGHRAYGDVLAQVSYGPRAPGSISHTYEINYIISELEKADWEVSLQETTWNGFPINNVIAYRGLYEDTATIILGAHYDSRLLADQELESQLGRAVPGANDGASGVAILLELARSLPEDTVPVWLVFFDAEDNGGLEDRDWIMGSRAFVASMMFSPQAVVIVDMVGDADLNIYIEINSDPALAQEIWGQAADLGYMQFIMEKKYSILDDHSAFLEAGIPAVDIIDFDYPFWHTQADTPDKISEESLQAVGETLWTWITLK
jgi:glutaminyl-peptide cyclotransferase